MNREIKYIGEASWVIDQIERIVTGNWNEAVMGACPLIIWYEPYIMVFNKLEYHHDQLEDLLTRLEDLDLSDWLVRVENNKKLILTHTTMIN